MINTVADLIRELEQFPPDAFICAAVKKFRPFIMAARWSDDGRHEVELHLYSRAPRRAAQDTDTDEDAVSDEPPRMAP